MKRIYLTVGSRILMGYGHADMAEYLAIKIPGQVPGSGESWLVSMSSGLGLTTLEYEGWYPQRKFNVYSYSTNDKFEKIQWSAVDPLRDLQEEIGQYFR